MADRHAGPDGPRGRRTHAPGGIPTGGHSLRWWLPVMLGVSAIAAGIFLQLAPDAPPRVMAAVVGVVLALGGIACLRRQVVGWVVLAPVAAAIWLLSGLFQFVVAASASGRSGDRLLALAGVSTVVGTAFALWPRSMSVVPVAGTSDPPEAEPSSGCSRCSLGAFHQLRTSSSGSSVQGPWTPRPTEDIAHAATRTHRRMTG